MNWIVVEFDAIEDPAERENAAAALEAFFASRHSADNAPNSPPPALNTRS